MAFILDPILTGDKVGEIAYWRCRFLFDFRCGNIIWLVISFKWLGFVGLSDISSVHRSDIIPQEILIMWSQCYNTLIIWLLFILYMQSQLILQLILVCTHTSSNDHNWLLLPWFYQVITWAPLNRLQPLISNTFSPNVWI